MTPFRGKRCGAAYCRPYPVRDQCGSAKRFMEESDVENAKIGRICVIVIFALSSATMLWLLWRFPMGTALGALESCFYSASSLIFPDRATRILSQAFGVDRPLKDPSSHDLGYRDD